MRSFALAIALTVAPLPASAVTWTTSPIDPERGWTVSLEVDQAFHAHAAYWSVNGGFKYSFYDGTSWQTDSLPSPITLANESGVERLATPTAAQLIFVGRSDLTLTAETPWVAYMKVVNSHPEDGPLKVAHKESGAWVAEHIDYNCQSSVHIAAGAEGPVYLAYRSSFQGWQFVIRNGTWTADPAGIPGIPMDLRLDHDGTPWILYYDANALWAGRREGPGSWTSMLVDVGNTGGFLQFDSQNRPCVAYVMQTPGTNVYRLIYAKWMGTDWVNTWVAQAGDHVSIESFVLDESDEPWIAYRDFTTSDVNVIHRSAGSWNIDLVDTPSSSYASITLDALGRHWMAYNGSGLRLARTAQPTGIGDLPHTPPVTALRVTHVGANPVRAGSASALQLESPIAGTVRVETFDLAGRRLMPPQSMAVGAGTFEYAWTTPEAHGLCLVRATMGARSSVARVMVIP